MKKKTRLLSTKLAVALAVIVTLSFSFNQALAAEGQVLRMACKYGDAKSLDAHRATGSQDRLIRRCCSTVLYGINRATCRWMPSYRIWPPKSRLPRRSPMAASNGFSSSTRG